MSRRKHPWCEKKNTSFYYPTNSMEEFSSVSFFNVTSCSMETDPSSPDRAPLQSCQIYSSSEADPDCPDNARENDIFLPSLCSSTATSNTNVTSGRNSNNNRLRLLGRSRRAPTIDHGGLGKLRLDYKKSFSATSEERTIDNHQHVNCSPPITRTEGVHQEAGQNTTRSARGRALRPQLRRAISEASCRIRGQPKETKNETRKSNAKQLKARSARSNLDFVPGVTRRFDSVILEMPVGLLEESESNPYATRSNLGRTGRQGLVGADLNNAVNSELMNDSFTRDGRFSSGFPPAGSQPDVTRPKRPGSKGIRRMHSTAVDGTFEASSFRRPGASFCALNNPVLNESAMENPKTVTFSSLEMEDDKSMKKNLSSDNLPAHMGFKLPTSIQLTHYSISTSSSTLAVRTNTLSGSRPNENEQLTDKSTSTNNFNLNSHSTYSIAALADGNFVEQGSEMAKLSTSSYLKEQFLAFFQPSDNKLAMKLFGSKNALLKEKRRQAQQGKWIIHPCSSFRFYWDLLMLVLLIANLIILPVAISFFNDDLSIHWIIFNSISDIIFIADIAVKFRTGVVTNDYADEIILNPKEIARHYLKSWFVLDCISSIPMDYIYLIFNKKDHYNQFFSAGRTLRILRLAKLLSMLRLLRLTRLVRYVSQWEEFLNIASKFMGIFNLVLLMLLLGHWNACLQYLIPMLMEFPPDSWVKRCKLENADWFQQYTWALFKAMSHMLSIGYGRFPPISIGDAWITIVSMMSGATCYALFVGHAAALIQSFDTSKRLYREKFKQVEEYMAYRKLPRALRQRIANYYEHRYQGKMFDEAQILNEFSECLREQIINYNCRALVAAVPFFTYADQDFVSEVVTKLKFEVFQPGDLIIKEGTMGNKMYFIQEGIVDIITKDGEVATSLSDGSYFGEICLLTNARRVASVKAVVYSNLYSLDRESFLSVLDNYPLMRRTMESVAAERLSKIGQNPAIVSNREDLKEDLSLVKEIVSSAVTPEASSSEHETENDETQSYLNLKHLLKLGKYKRQGRRSRNGGSDTETKCDEQDDNETVEHLPLTENLKPKISIPNAFGNMGKLFRGTGKQRTNQLTSAECDLGKKLSASVQPRWERKTPKEQDSETSETVGYQPVPESSTQKSPSQVGNSDIDVVIQQATPEHSVKSFEDRP
ncbi:Cyclic nucleotide and voltage-activated ion channel [Fasciola gigantica]|uniref:Cyclic nucleotide and voltage-activated ion channel n=1 Tax=Fasciola gigantica TaxID=46835 RepID=A0A504YYK0_FASGI|nr:Cyclic nucleotide and voltage-activated ion channel [Fasciola gigantica]